MPDLTTILSELFEGKTIKSVVATTASYSQDREELFEENVEQKDVIIFETTEGTKVGIEYSAVGVLTEIPDSLSH